LKRFCCFIAGLILFCAGCREDAEVQPAAIRVQGSRIRCGLLEEKQSVAVLVTGKGSSSIWDSGDAPPVRDALVRLVIVDQPEGAGAASVQSEGRTDAGGRAALNFRIGSKPGVYELSVELPETSEVGPARITVLGGIKVLNSGQDGWVGGALDKPISVHVESAPGLPAEGAEVQFDLRHAGKKARLSASQVLTGPDGRASVRAHLGEEASEGEIGITLLDTPLGGRASRYTLKAHFLAIDLKSLLLTVLGGLAIFIFGMKLMSEGLSLVAGDRLKGFLRALTSNRFLGVIAGMVTTMLIQSSSACTVMVVGFVNAGLMQLRQAIGVIMGSNIGTTVTAQLISFKLDALALPAIVIGVLLSLLSGRRKHRHIGRVLIGFGMLFLGMSMMSGTLKGLRESVTLQSLFHGVSCTPTASGMVPLFGALRAIFVGALLTVIVQSSSAAIGLLLALSGAGLLDVYTAFAILLGGNIGTTITAVLASIGTSRGARRAACAHCLFNLVGSGVMIALLFMPWPGEASSRPIFMELVDRVTAGDAFEGENLPRYLANAHTLFNVTCTLLFIGFVPAFDWACRKIIRGEDPEDSMARLQRFLEPYFLASPAIAIEQAWAELGDMLAKSREVCRESFRALIGEATTEWNELYESLRDQERVVDALQDALTDYVRAISQEQLTDEQGITLPRLLHSVNDAERIGDYGIQLLRLARRRRKRNLPFSDEALLELKQMFAEIEKLFDHCCLLLANRPDESGKRPLETMKDYARNYQDARKAFDEIKQMVSRFRKTHERRYEAGHCDVRAGVIFVDALVSFRRLAGHLTNIVQAATPDAVQRSSKSDGSPDAGEEN